ncbi:hypothetical protein QYE76_002887 [Lolium multiflorum]|uniref:Reverse transcriptase Ty1/copia-type domain-containing protein n=1 Tax=Lolium multiflorum TaxID=4521 RepID=A0AAD8RQI2_LOLMU|nr:hypothetical protein QYE76_002887 [Lolium multiflorum]
MSLSGTPKDSFFEDVVNPYMNELKMHPKELLLVDGELQIKDVQGPKGEGSLEDRMEKLEQEVFNYKKMAEREVDIFHKIVSELIDGHKKETAKLWDDILSLHDTTNRLKRYSMMFRLKTRYYRSEFEIPIWSKDERYYRTRYRNRVQTLLDPKRYQSGNKPNVMYIRVSGCKCLVKNNKGKLGKFETRTIDGTFVGYAENSHAYRYYNKSTGAIEVSCDVVFLEDNGSQVEQVVPCVAGDDDPSNAIKLMGIGHIRPTEVHTDDQSDEIEVQLKNLPLLKMSHILKNKKKTLNPLSKIMMMIKTHPQLMFKLKLSLMINFEPLKVHEALVDPDWVIAMQEELECFTRNEVWYLVERPKDRHINVIGTKWVFKNKQDENGIVIRNKARQFEMSMMGELKFFLGFQVRQLENGTFISQERYVKDMPKKFDMTNANPMKTPMPVKGKLGSCDGEKDVDIKKCIWDDFYNSRECMKNGVIVMPKAINKEVLSMHEATKYRFVVDTLKGMGLYDLVCLKRGDEKGAGLYCPILVHQFHCIVFFHDDIDRTMTWMTGKEKYTCNYLDFCEAMGFGGGRARGFKIHSQDKFTHGNIAFCYPLEPTAGPPTISGMYYSYLVLANLFRENLISKSGDSSECRAYHLNLMYYCRPENIMTIDGDPEGQNEFMDARNHPVPPPGPEMEPVIAPTWEMPPIDDEMLQNFDLSMLKETPHFDNKQEGLFSTWPARGPVRPALALASPALTGPWADDSRMMYYKALPRSRSGPSSGLDRLARSLARSDRTLCRTARFQARLTGFLEEVAESDRNQASILATDRSGRPPPGRPRAETLAAAAVLPSSSRPPRRPRRSSPAKPGAAGDGGGGAPRMIPPCGGRRLASARGGWPRTVEGGGGAAPRREAGDGGGGMALIWGRSSPLPRRDLRAGGDGGGVSNPKPGGAILSFRPSLGIAGPAVMETDLALLLLMVWDHGTKGGGPGWRWRHRPGGRWRAWS